MTTLVLVVLAVVWGVVLFSWFRTRARAAFGDPVGTFHRHLSVLENAGPSMRHSSDRLRMGASLGSSWPASVNSRNTIGGPRASNALARLSDPEPAYPASRPGVARPVSRPTSAASIRRQQSLKRRKDVLLALVSGVVGTFLLGLLPGLHALLLLNLIFDLLLATYVSLLIRLRNLAAERDRKLAYLPRTAPADLARAASARNATRLNPGRASQGAGRRRPAPGFDRLSGYDPGRYEVVAN